MINSINQVFNTIENRDNSTATLKILEQQFDYLKLRMLECEVVVEHNYISISLVSDILSFLKEISENEKALEVEVLSLIMDLEEHISVQLSQA